MGILYQLFKALHVKTAGTPGIGKTYFKFPLMRWLIEEKMAKSVVLQVC